MYVPQCRRDASWKFGSIKFLRSETCWGIFSKVRDNLLGLLLFLVLNNLLGQAASVIYLVIYMTNHFLKTPRYMVHVAQLDLLFYQMQ